MDDRCVSCGTYVPEGRMVCPNCETKAFEDEYSEKCALRNALGKYEDLGYTPDELKDIIKQSQCDIAQHIENCEDCGFCNKGEQNNE